MMMIPTPSVIKVQGGEVTIEASYLAAQLGLSVDRLRKKRCGGGSFTAWLSAAWART